MVESQQGRLLDLLKEQQERLESAHREEIEQQRQEVERVKAEVQELRAHAVETKLREQQVAALQMRLQSLITGKLLSQEELYCCEDIIADSVEVGGRVQMPGGADERVATMVALSERLSSDAAFARQLRRKFATQ